MHEPAHIAQLVASPMPPSRVATPAGEADSYHLLAGQDSAAPGSPGRQAAEETRPRGLRRLSGKLARTVSEDETLKRFEQQGLIKDEDTEPHSGSGRQRYCEIDELLSDEVSSLAKILGLSGNQTQESSEAGTPKDVQLLHRWRCRLGSYNVAVVDPVETKGERLRFLFNRQRATKVLTGSAWNNLLSSPRTSSSQLPTLFEGQQDAQGEESAQEPAEQPAKEVIDNEEPLKELGCLHSRSHCRSDRSSAVANSCCCARKNKKVSRWVVCYSWFWFLAVTLGIALLACASWVDATVLDPMVQQTERKLPALNISLTANGVNSSFIVSVADRMDIAVESREGEVVWTRVGSALLVSPGKLGAIHFRELMLPPGVHVHKANLLLEAVTYDPRMLAEAPMPLKGAFGQARGAEYARSAPQDVEIFAEKVSDSEPFVGSTIETRTLSKRIWQPYLRSIGCVWSVPRSEGAVRNMVTTTDMSEVLQELVDLPDWTTRSGVTLFLAQQGGEGMSMFTNGHRGPSKLMPVLLTLWWFASFVLQLRFQSPSAKFRIADISDSHEHRMAETITRLIVIVNASVALCISVLSVLMVLERECTASGWFIRVVVSIMAIYSMNLFALWTAYFWIACNHLLEVITSKWQLISQQTHRLVNALLNVACLRTSGQVNALHEYKDSRAAMKQIALAMKPQKFRRGVSIIDDRDKITKHSAMYIIDSGEVLVTEMRNGIWIKRTLTDGEAFGEAALRSNETAEASDYQFLSAVAAVDTSCFALSFHELRLLREEVMEVKNQHITDMLHHCDLFKKLEQSELIDLAKHMDSKHFNEGEYLMEQNESVNDDSKMYIIVTGTVEIKVQREDESYHHFSNEAGGHQGRLFRSHGSYVGERSFIERQAIRSASVVATEPTRCLCISRRDFMPYLDSATIKGRKYMPDGSSDNDSKLGGFDLADSIGHAQTLSTMALGLNEDFRMDLWQMLICLGLSHLCLLSQIFGEIGQTTVHGGGNVFLETVRASPTCILPAVAEFLLALVTCLIMLIPTRISILGDRMVADTNTLQWNMRDFCTNSTVSQELSHLVSFLRGINRGNGIGFFLLNTDDGNVSVKLTPSLVKASLVTVGMVLLSLFTKHRGFIANLV